ncbi:uncharacterized protein LOC133730907 [Rosa rugosa]|uniref:uncharacterized protein LOC133730907 n=1 Tax=Rosa rugosa TaxID=74645 RepID=UPI002B41484D|nr:uncharacterized protein LOC133730907 [Rosa rugosa]
MPVAVVPEEPRLFLWRCGPQIRISIRTLMIQLMIMKALKMLRMGTMILRRMMIYLEDNIDIEGENMAYGFENPNQAKSDSEEYFAPALSNSMHSQVWVVITQCRIFWGLLSVPLGREAGNLMRIWMQNLLMLLTLNEYPMLELSWMFTYDKGFWLKSPF